MIAPLRLHAVTPDDAPPSVVDWLREVHARADAYAKTAKPGRDQDGWRTFAAHTAFRIEELSK